MVLLRSALAAASGRLGAMPMLGRTDAAGEGEEADRRDFSLFWDGRGSTTPSGPFL